MRVRRNRIRPHLAIAAALMVAKAVLAQSTPTFANVTVHDPSIVRTGGTFYVFGSHLASASSTDLQRWTQLSTAPVAGNSLFPNPTAALAEAIAWTGGSYGFWAPDVIQLGDGRFYYYYCIGRLDQPRAALGLAVADAITGPYTHEAILLRSGPGGQPPEAGASYDPTIHPNTIDPSVFFDQSGKLWMIYGSYSGGIFIVELNPADGRPKPGQGYGRHLIGGNHARIEGAYILYSRESEYYYLFVSYGGLAADGGYNIRVGRSRAPDGPFVDAAGTDLATVKGAPGSLFDDASIAPHGVKLMGGYQFLAVAGEPSTRATGYLSPGHNSVYYDAETGNHFLVFHTRFVGRGEIHEVRVHPMFVNADDWLVVAPHRFAGETIEPAIRAQLPGTYKVINHGKTINSTTITSTNVTLQANGDVTGTMSGTWTLSGDFDCTLALNGTTYRGVFLQQWDQDQQRWVMTFSALSSDGTALWGSKVAIPVAPVIIVAPSSVDAAHGDEVVLTVSVTADPAPTYQWYKDGLEVPGATTDSLAILQVKVTDAGSYTVTISNAAGTVISPPATLNVAAVPPFISQHPASVTQPPGTSATLEVEATGAVELAYQWFKDDAPIAGATSAALSFAALAPTDAGFYTVEVADENGQTTSRPARVVVASPSPGRIVNMSVRSSAGRQGQPLIVGFVMAGGSKDVLIRGIGPALIPHGVQGSLPDPRLEVHATINGADTILVTNDNWGDDGMGASLAAEFQRLGAFALSDTGSKDAALLTAMAGLRTVHINSATAGIEGIVLVEGYDAGDGQSPRLVNISARNFAGQGFETLIAGFIVSGNKPKRVLIRGVGPTLEDHGVSGVLGNPRLEVHTLINNVDRTIATNDNWADEPGAAEAAQASGAFALREGSADAAIVMSLSAGSYTALVSAVGQATGEALVEVYELP